MFEFRSRRRRQGSMPVGALESRILPAAVNVITKRAPGGAVHLAFAGTSSNDTVNIIKDPVTGRSTISGPLAFLGQEGTTTFRLNGRTEVAQLSFAKLGNLTFNLGAGDDFVSVTDSSAGHVTIKDGFADQENNIYFFSATVGEMRIGNIRASFDRGHSSTIVSSIGGSLRTGSVAVQGTASSLSTDLIINGSGSHLLTLNGLVSLDLADGATGSSSFWIWGGDGLSLLKGMRYTGGAGYDVLQTQGQVSVSGNVTISTRGGNDDIALGDGAVVFQGNVTIDTGTGADRIGFSYPHNQTTNVVFMKKVNISMGADNDSVSLGNVVFRQSVFFDMGDNSDIGYFGQDYINIINVEVFGQTHVVSTGQAFVVFNPRGNSKTQLHGASKFILGLGSIQVESTSSNVFFDNQLLFQGTERDLVVTYHGQVMANPGNLTLVNAHLHTY